MGRKKHEKMPIPGERAPVCLNCLSPNDPLAAYCSNCGMPIGMFAATDPIRQIHSQGWGYRKAVSGPPRRLVLVGMWVIFGPALVAAVVGVADLARQVGGVSGVLGLALAGAILVIYGVILLRTTRRYVLHRVREHRYKRGRCGNCLYDLRGLAEPRCPECGTPFDPDMIATQLGAHRSE
jgi:hypothetical protein